MRPARAKVPVVAWMNAPRLVDPAMKSCVPSFYDVTGRLFLSFWRDRLTDYQGREHLRKFGAVTTRSAPFCSEVAMMTGSRRGEDRKGPDSREHPSSIKAVEQTPGDPPQPPKREIPSDANFGQT